MTQKTTTLVSPRWSSPLKTVDGSLLPSKGKHVCQWIETHCVCGEGDYFGQPAKLRQFQRRFLYRLYEYYPESGRRRYRRAVFGVGKGNGKTPIAAWIAAHELLCPECAPLSPRVITGAASLKQADLVFGDLRVCVTESKTLSPHVEAFDLEIHRRGSPGVAERVAAVAGANDGARCSCFLADELHEWINRTARVFLIIDGAVAKRQNAFTLAITTAFVEGTDTPLAGMYEHGKRVASGEVIDDAFLFEWYEADENLDLDDEEQFLQAVLQANPGANPDDEPFNSIENIRYRYETIPLFEFVRYHLNRPTTVEDDWLPDGTWPALFSEDELVSDHPSYVGVDVGIKHDATALTVGQWHEGKLRVRSRIWERPLEGDGRPVADWRLPITEVENQIRDWHRIYDLQAVGYDPALFHRSAEQLETEGILMVEVPQSDSRMVPACQTLYQLAVEGRIEHDGDPTLERHVHSAVAVEARSGAGWRLTKKKSKHRMDGAIALAVMVYVAAFLEDDAEDDEVLVEYDQRVEISQY